MGFTSSGGDRPLGQFVERPNSGAVKLSGNPIIYTISGEFTADDSGVPLTSPDFDGYIQKVNVSLGASGKDDTNTLSVEVDVKVNTSTIFTTKPKIAHVSGEASQAKNTLSSGDGITEAVYDRTATDFDAGDIIYADIDVTRTASPTTEMSNLVLSVYLAEE